MNILIDELPKSVQIDGVDYPVNWGFRTFVLIEICIFDTKLTDAERIEMALALFYDRIPKDSKAAFNQMMWFYRGGKEERPVKAGKRAPKRNVKRVYCFEQDAPYIYSAFMTQYGIDLQDISNTDLHWWKFLSLFTSLNDELKMSKIMSYRVTDVSGMDKKQKAFYNDMKTLHALDVETNADDTMRLAKRDEQMKDYIKRRTKEVSDVSES